MEGCCASLLDWRERWQRTRIEVLLQSLYSKDCKTLRLHVRRSRSTNEENTLLDRPSSDKASIGTTNNVSIRVFSPCRCSLVFSPKAISRDVNPSAGSSREQQQRGEVKCSQPSHKVRRRGRKDRRGAAAAPLRRAFDTGSTQTAEADAPMLLLLLPIAHLTLLAQFRLHVLTALLRSPARSRLCSVAAAPLPPHSSALLCTSS